MEGDISMSHKEVERLKILQKLELKSLNQTEAATHLKLSVRQMKRLWKSFKEDGIQGIISQKRGKPSNRRLKDEIKSKVLELLSSKYQDFGPTFAHEKLVEVHGLTISVTSVRNLMIKHHLWINKKAKTKMIHPLRERRACFGELIQIDGSHHDWFCGRAPKCVLLVSIDDATGSLMELLFCTAETTESYFELMRKYIDHYGRPLALYSDKDSIFRVSRTHHFEGPTQFARAMKELDIELICAHSPQAKGRIERANKTLQDRLVKELTLQGISSIEEANAFLPQFLKSYNQKFGREPKDSFNAHRDVSHDLDKILTCQYVRILSRNLILQYNNLIYQIKPTAKFSIEKKAKVLIWHKRTGEVVLEYKGQVLNYEIYNQAFSQPKTLTSKELYSNISKPSYIPHPSHLHPWKRYNPGWLRR